MWILQNSQDLTFYAIDKIISYWPFGKISSCLRIFKDKGLTSVSVLMIFVLRQSREQHVHIIELIMRKTILNLESNHIFAWCQHANVYRQLMILLIVMCVDAQPDTADFVITTSTTTTSTKLLLLLLELLHPTRIRIVTYHSWRMRR